MKKILLFIVGLFGIFGTCFGAGVYNNPENTLISVSVDGENWLTYESFDYGYLSGAVCIFQYGNNHCFTTGGNSVNNFSSYVDFTPFSYNGFSTGNLFVVNGSFLSVYGSNSNFLNFALNTWGAKNSSAIVQGPCNEGFHIMNINEATFLVNSLSVFGLSKCQAPTILFSQSNSYSLNPDGTYTRDVYQGQRYLGGGYTDEFPVKIYVSRFSSWSQSCYNEVTSRPIGYYNAYSIRCVRDSSISPNSSWVVRTGDIITSPKFKINYGNTSTEYELTDNLNIYLKSATIQNGNTFTYAGSTGINLFFNGTSQFYNKDELYLNTPSRFNNNVFTPICL